MGNFNRDNRGGGRGFERRGFNDRSSRGPAPYRSGTGPVQMHRATCDKCRKDCEVPFRPTSGKPVFCSSCFENNRDSDSRYESRNSGRSANFKDRQMFEAVCNECGNSCKVPFQPRGDKPVYCSNCFGDKKGNGDRSREQFKSQPQYTEQFEQLNNKLDKILKLLTPETFVEVAKETVAQVITQPVELEVEVEKKPKAKKSPSKKK